MRAILPTAPTAIVVLAAAFAPFASADTIDRVLAVVAGKVLTMTDVTAVRELGLDISVAASNSVGASNVPTTAEAAILKDSDPIRVVLSKLIDRELVLDEVDRYSPPEPSTEAVDRELAVVRGRFPSPAAFDDALARSGMDQPRLREMVRQDLRIRTYEDQRFPPTDPRRQTLIDDWIAGLRRRGNVTDLYVSAR